ncbi:MAG: protein-disulfide reductase DsbD family protein, partial [Myxococcaceae bacterium]
YTVQDVIRESERFTNIKVDATESGDLTDVLFERYGVQGLPVVAFVSSAGVVLEDPRVTGFLGPDKFLPEMKKVQ